MVSSFSKKQVQVPCFQMEHDYEMDKKSGTKNQDHREES